VQKAEAVTTDASRPPSHARRARLLGSIFSVRWPFALLLCLAFVFWPVVAFGPGVVFEPAHFIEIWLQLTSTAIIIIFVVELVQDRRRERDSLVAIADILDETVLPDLADARAALGRMSLGTGQPTDDSLSAIQTVLDKLRSVDLPVRLATQLTQRSHLHIHAERLRNKLDTDRWLRTLGELQSEDHWYDADADDFATLVNELAAAEQSTREFVSICRRL